MPSNVFTKATVVLTKATGTQRLAALGAQRLDHTDMEASRLAAALHCKILLRLRRRGNRYRECKSKRATPTQAARGNERRLKNDIPFLLRREQPRAA